MLPTIDLDTKTFSSKQSRFVLLKLVVNVVNTYKMVRYKEETRSSCDYV